MMSHHLPVDPLRSRLPRYATALAHLSRVLPAIARQAGVEATLLVSARAPVLIDPAQVTIESDAGRARLRFDLSCSPALESIVADRNDARRTALANLYLAPWLAALQPAGTGALVVREIGRDGGPESGDGTNDGTNDDTNDDTEDGSGAPTGAVPRHEERGPTHGVALTIAADAPCVVHDIDATLVEALARGLANAAPDTATDANAPGARDAALACAPDPCRRHLTAHLSAHLSAHLVGHLAGRLHLATRPLRLDVLNTLRAGDVVLGWPLPAPYQPGAPLRGLALRWGAAHGMQAHAMVSTRGNQLILETPLTMIQDTQDDAALAAPVTDRPWHDPAAADAAAPLQAPAVAPTAPTTVAPALDLGPMTVPVRVELVTLALALDAIAALQPGSVVELPAPLDSAVVQLVCCGHTVAHGQLVAVGDNLGVRIVQATQVSSTQSNPMPSAAAHGR
ncbi:MULTISPECIES: FliM/FliN family flagellar motor switch protein [unclassified Cupriavidus]|uniref:FliM/FliN family flagellar motor switch protein n=1 Tax=Cupriavidus sp. H19C3 TaxID=3241603 RepID=UPI003BF8453D